LPFQSAHQLISFRLLSFISSTANELISSSLFSLLFSLSYQLNSLTANQLFSHHPNSNEEENPKGIRRNIHRIENPVRQIKLDNLQNNTEQKD